MTSATEIDSLRPLTLIFPAHALSSENTTMADSDRLLIHCPADEDDDEEATTPLTQALSEGSLNIEDMHFIVSRLVRTLANMHAACMWHGELDASCVYLGSGKKVIMSGCHELRNVVYQTVN